MSGNRKRWPDRNQSDNAPQGFPDDNSTVEVDPPVPDDSGLALLLRAAQIPVPEMVEKHDAGSHAHGPPQHYSAPPQILPVHMPTTDRSASPPTSNGLPRAHTYLSKSPSLPGVERQHLLFSLVVVLFVVISAAALLAPVLVIVSPKPLREFAEVAIVKARSVLAGAKAASNRKRKSNVEPEQPVFRGAKQTTIDKLESNYAQSARLAAAAEKRRLAALEAQRVFAAERRREASERQHLAALLAAAEKEKGEEAARDQRLAAEAERRRLAALEAQRAFAAERRREEPARRQYDSLEVERWQLAAFDAKSTYAATRRTVAWNELLFTRPTQLPVGTAGEVMPLAPSMIIQAGSVMATTQVLIGRPTARAQKKLANGFVLTSAITRQTLKSAWRNVASRQMTAEPHYRRRSQNWFAIAWRDASVSHYVLAIANGSNVASLHIDSPLNSRKSLNRSEQRAVTRIACANSFGDAALPCASR